MQAYSLKKADPTKLDDYFVYLAKGVRGKRSDDVNVVHEHPAPRLWAELHERYHSVAEERAVARRRDGPQDFYEMLAQRCRDERKTSSRDVLAVVASYYVRDAKKGYDAFMVQRTFGRVFALVNGDECQSWLYEQCERMLFR